MRNPSKQTAAVAVMIVALVAALVAAPSAVSADDNVTYSATVSVPAPPASNFPGASGGGDGWAVALSPTRFYNVFHHSGVTTVNCRNQADATQCWSPKTIVDGNGGNYRTSIAPGLYLAQDTGHLFVAVTRATDDTAGALCIDTSLPDSATGAEMFCGFTALSGVGDSPQDFSASGLSNPVQMGSKWYMVNEAVGTATGTKDMMLCFDLSSFGPCAGQPFAIDWGGATYSSASYSKPMGSSGTMLFPQLTGSSRVITCFDTTTNGDCNGTWPKTVGSGETGPPYPMMDANAVPIGVCDQTSGNPCWNFAGDTVSTPAGMTTAIVPSSVPYTSQAVTIGPRVYVANATGNKVGCYDYAQQAGCANFPKVLSNLSLLYSVNPDPQRPACIWVNADSGSAQIQNFDAFTAGPCGQGAIRVLSSSVVVPNNECVPTSWMSLQVLSPERATYSTGSVSFQDGSGNAIPGFPAHALDGTGTADLTDLQLNTTNALPQFLITLNDAGTIGSVQVKLTWGGKLSDACKKVGTTVTGLPLPPVVPTGPTPVPGYRIGALDGGVFTFGGFGFNGSVAGGSPLNGRIVGIVNTPSGNGYWLVAEDGGVFAFGDAAFFGSVPGLGISVRDIVAIVPTITGNGYWIVERNGGVFSFGDALFHGSAPSIGLTVSNVVGAIGTTTGGGYWLVQRNGGVLSFGDAGFYGSAPSLGISVDNVVGMAGTRTGNGYWLVQRNGGVLSFGDALFFGSVPLLGLTLDDVVGMGVTPSGLGYWLLERNGGVLSFGDAVFWGSLAISPLNAPPVGMATWR